MAELKVDFLDSGRGPRCAPNPAFPDGVDLDTSDGRLPACWVKLPVVQTTGMLIVTCPTCGKSAAITVAGRPDDPRSYKMDCFSKGLPPLQWRG
jgi:hypothetical protein